MTKNFNVIQDKINHHLAENATKLIAHFSGSLAASRLARKSEKRTPNSVQQRNLEL